MTNCPLSWDLEVVLRDLHGGDYEPMADLSLWAFIKKTFFLVALATAKHVNELCTVFSLIVSQGNNDVLCYPPEFHSGQD